MRLYGPSELTRPQTDSRPLAPCAATCRAGASAAGQAAAEAPAPGAVLQGQGAAEGAHRERVWASARVSDAGEAREVQSRGKRIDVGCKVRVAPARMRRRRAVPGAVERKDARAGALSVLLRRAPRRHKEARVQVPR